MRDQETIAAPFGKSVLRSPSRASIVSKNLCFYHTSVKFLRTINYYDFLILFYSGLNQTFTGNASKDVIDARTTILSIPVSHDR